MSSEVSAPVSTTVIACDIAGATAFGAAVLDSFDTVLAAARSLGFVTRDPGRPTVTLTLAPELALGAALESLAKAATGFDAAAAPLRLRAMVHFGVVFRAVSAGEASYVGSAIRSAQSALRRAPPVGGFVATQEFCAHAAKQLALPFRMQPVAGRSAVEGLSEIVFSGSTVAPQKTEVAQRSVDPAFLEFVKRRLAEDIGPFASALVDRAVRASTAADRLIEVLGREIDKPDARARFAGDIERYFKSRDIAR